MKVELTAVIKEIGQIEAFGESQFQKRNVILTEQSGEYENIYCFEFSGDKISDPERYQVGQTVKIGGFVSCRQWQDKFFTSLRASFIQSTVNEQTQPQQFGTAPQSPQFAQQPQAPMQPTPPQPQQFAQPVAAQNSQPSATPQQFAQQPIAQNMGAPMLDQNGNPLPF